MVTLFISKLIREFFKVSLREDDFKGLCTVLDVIIQFCTDLLWFLASSIFVVLQIWSFCLNCFTKMCKKQTLDDEEDDDHDDEDEDDD